MKAIKIDAVTKTVTEIDIPEGGSLKAMQNVVGGLICAACELPNADTLFVNDEGMFMFDNFFYLAGNVQPNAGIGLIVGTDAEGSSVAVKSTLEEIQARVVFMPRAKVLQFCEENGLPV